jgi:hypothetical protein
MLAAVVGLHVAQALQGRGGVVAVALGGLGRFRQILLLLELRELLTPEVAVVAVGLRLQLAVQAS